MYEGSACLTQGRGVKPSLRPKPVTNYITSNPGGSPGRLDVGTVSRGINEAGPGSEKKEGVSDEIVNGIRTLGEIGSRTSAQSSQASGGKNGTRHLELSGKGEPYRAVARFEKVQNSELSLNEGDMVDVLEKKDGGWWFVRSGVDEGWVPASYLETRLSILISRPMPHSGDVYVAIADYAGDDETLGFDEGVSLEVIERHPNGWWYCKLLDGRCEDSEGWAPSNYLERKVLAQQHKMLCTSTEATQTCVKRDESHTQMFTQPKARFSSVSAPFCECNEHNLPRLHHSQTLQRKQARLSRSKIKPPLLPFSLRDSPRELHSLLQQSFIANIIAPLIFTAVHTPIVMPSPNCSGHCGRFGNR
uniref:SH3 domain-containing protein n=1 Tax=Eptatretus burgeri TaxID=7764 RepID=A0A8C4QY65_EPTBU